MVKGGRTSARLETPPSERTACRLDPTSIGQMLMSKSNCIRLRLRLIHSESHGEPTSGVSLRRAYIPYLHIPSFPIHLHGRAKPGRYPVLSPI